MTATRDWQRVETEYVTSEIDARELADKYSIAYPTLRDHMRREDWVAKRTAHRSNLVAKTLEFAEQNELTARAMAGRATQQAFLDFASLSPRERGKRFPELLKLWAAMTGETTERSAINDESTIDDAELERIATGSGARTADTESGAAQPD